MLKNLKSNHLTNATLFKRPGGKSWTLVKNTNQIVIHEDNQATNWGEYIENCHECSLEGSGYQLHTYKRTPGIKKVVAPFDRPWLKKPTVTDAFKKGFIQFGIDKGYIK